MHDMASRSLIVLTSLASLASLVSATCPGFPCDVIAVKFAEDGQTCGVDPNDRASVLINYAFCPCGDGLLRNTLTATQANGNINTVVGAATTYEPGTDIVFFAAPFTQPWNQIAVDTPVTVNVLVNGFAVNAQFNYSPITSLHYTATTTTLTAVNSVTATTTTTTEATSTVTQPQQTQSMPCTTGTLTNTAPASTKTLTSTITPAPVTKSKFPKIIFTTVHRSCVSLPFGRGHKRAEAREALLQARDPDADFEEPTCFPRDAPPDQTTITTATIMSTVTVDSTITTTSTQTTTTTTTSLPTPLTTTVCSNVQGTVTTTPTVTTTATSTAKGVTVTKQKTLTFTKTIYPCLFPSICKTKPTKKPTLTSNCPKVTATSKVASTKRLM